MSSMSGGKKPGGYTIVEVMIVLAVSGMMFAIAATFINGKQATAAFRQGSNEMSSRIQGIIGQVTDGQYSDINQQCSYDPTGKVVTISPTGGSKLQGESAQCIFLGKLLHVRGDLADLTKYEVLSLVGGRLDSNGQPITKLSEAGTKIIPNLTIKQNVPQNLDIISAKAKEASSSANPDDKVVVAFGFLQGLGAARDDGLYTGAQNVSMYYTDVAIAGNDPDVSQLKLAQEIRLCISDGQRFARVFLGSNNSQLSSRVIVDKDQATCID
jgi:prepilin-type N-terminal cleavage/methylation domain-containing protein